MSKSIGFLPLRKGSKGIPNKNKRAIAGRPLFLWVLAEAVKSELDEVYIFTDDDYYKEYVTKNLYDTDKVKVVSRSAESATDTASTEYGILEFCDSIQFNFDVFCLLQATSPFTTSSDINNCLKKLKGAYDSALTVVRTHRFAWNSNGSPLNYDYMNRPRRQDFDGLLIENGAIYVSTKKALQKSRNRISGKIGLVEMMDESFHEIDTETDWILVEQLLTRRQFHKKKTKA